METKIAMRIDHFALYVNDLEQTREFFETYFGVQSGAKYHNRNTDFQSYFLTFADGNRLEIMTRPQLAPAVDADPRLGYHHLSIGVGSKTAVDELTNQLTAAGYRLVSGPRTTGDGYYESCVEGPEGILLELTV